ncbi:MAG TPA: hypothetical protein PKX93_11545, partial [bacterium]|nr:hypothetical protein [bacterium]
MKKKVVIFGAGQIGRGFIGDICAREGYFLVFVDVLADTVQRLNQERFYPLWILGEGKEEKKITGLKAVLLTEQTRVVEELADVSLAFTAVGASNLPSLGTVLAEAIQKKVGRQPDSFLNIIICENLLGSSEVLKKAIEPHLTPEGKTYLNDRVGLVETVVSRMVAPFTEESRKIHPLLVKVEPYCILPVARPSFKGEIPAIKALHPVENLLPYEELKLFGHNLTHAALAYLGWLEKLNFIWQAMENSRILKVVEGVRQEASQALIRQHHFPSSEVENYFHDLFHRFQNRLLGDTVSRVGRDPWRKLGPKERIVGAINLCLRHGIFPDAICLVAAACLCYNEPGDTQAALVQSLLKERGLDFFLSEHCQLTHEGVRNRIKAAY